MIEHTVLEKLLIALIYISTTFYLFGGVFMLLRGRENRSRRVMGYILLLFAACYMLRTVGVIFDIEYIGSLFSYKFGHIILLTGTLCIISAFMFPIEVMLPGWLNLKRVLILYAPFILLFGIYYLILAITGEKIEYLTDYKSLFASIGHFNVWFRAILVAMSFVYIILLLRFVFKYERQYRKWKDDLYASEDYMDISWMKYFALCVILIFIAYCIVLLSGSTISMIMHSIIMLGTCVYLFYRGLFQESPYPEGFFKNGTDIEIAQKKMSEIESVVDTVDNISDESFESRLPEYKKQFENWMDEEKPYLHHDFKLLDVSKALPLNRTYLSRLFNEGYSRNFHNIVRNYRIDYSKDLIKKHREMSVSEVAELSGFSSSSAFIKAFEAREGVTPNQYKYSLSSYPQK